MIELLEHLMQEYWGMRYQGQKPQLLPGEMPAQLPVEVPIPDKSRVVGSVIWPEATSILFDCSLSREEVIGFYDERLLSKGWIKPKMPDHFGGGGFTHNVRGIDYGASYCMGEMGPSLHVRAIGMEAQRVSMQVNLNTNADLSPCSPKMRRQFEAMRHGGLEILPKLEAPARATQMGGGQSGGGGRMSSEATLKTELEMSSIMTHYSEQLTKAGWQRTDSGESGPVGWSAWGFKYEGEDWHGLFTVLGQPWSEDMFRLTLYAEGNDQGLRSGFNFIPY